MNTVAHATPDSVVVFNELHYNPAGNLENDEWVELHNQMAVDIDLSRWELTGGVDFTFPEGTIILGHGFLVVAKDTGNPALNSPFGPYSGSLDNAGEIVRLRSNTGRLMDEMDYRDSGDWPVAPDGSGATLAKIREDTPSGPAANWRASAQVGGTPATTNFPSVEVPAPAGKLRINEIAGATTVPFWIELVNTGAADIDLEGVILSRNNNPATEHVLPAGTLSPEAYLIITQAELGFGFVDGDRLYLYTPDRAWVIDAQRVTDRLRGVASRYPGRWLYPTTSTPGAANVFTFTDDIVINEIHYHAPPTGLAGTFVESDEEWLELHNRGATPVDLGGWDFDNAVEFVFPPGTILTGGGFLVITRDLATFVANHPGVVPAGQYSGGLGNAGELLELRDANRNPADIVHYHEGGRWPEFADGGGSSLELRDPRADNAVAEAWAPSDESGQTSWATYSYRMLASASPVGHDGAYEEFVLGLLDAGELLIDDLSVIEDPDGTAIELISDGDFQDLNGWRAVGNHRGSRIMPDPDAPANLVLNLVARGPTEHLNNHLETTLAGGRSVVNGREYEVSYRARWITGSDLVNTRLFFNRVARTMQIARPVNVGTPGAMNSRAATNIGPTFTGVAHNPPVPPAGLPVTISAIATDPDTVASMTLYYSVSGGAFASVPMTAGVGGVFQASVPGQPARTVVQFYIEGQDGLGMVSAFPHKGPDSRALFQVEDGRAWSTGIHNLRVIKTQADSDWMRMNINLMSNDPIPCTVISDEREIFYDCGIRFRGSARGRIAVPNIGFKIFFGADQRFRGVHESVLLDRSGFSAIAAGSQFEMLHHQASQHAGVIPAKINDLVYIMNYRDDETSSSELVLAGYKPEFLEAQFNNGDQGTVFKYEAVYPQTGTDANGYKYPTQSGDLDRTDVTDLGNDVEDYRHTFLIRNNRDRDDYRKIIEFAKFFDLSGAPFHAMVDDVLDTDQYLRALAYTCATGGNDQYFNNRQHNAMFYQRPDGRILFFPHDIDRVGSASSSITLCTDLQTIINDPAKWRRYLGHLQDITESSFRSTYLQRWSDHFAALTGQNFEAHKTYLNTRANSVLSQINAAAPAISFAIITNNGDPFSVNAPNVTLEVSGWINIREIRLAGGVAPVQVLSSDAGGWQLLIPLAPGVNPITLEAIDFRGNVVGSDSITVTSTSPVAAASAANLGVAEIMYHPADPNGAEIAAGFTDDDDFEFIELINFGADTIDLTGVRFTEGISFNFASGTLLVPAETLVVPGNAAAFSFRYAAALPTNITEGYQVAGANILDNGGETLTLVDGGGIEIFRFTYGDEDPWPPSADGIGYSLVSINPGGADDLDLATSWRPSVGLGGTPGTSDSMSFSGGSLVEHALWGAGDLTLTQADDDYVISYRRNLATDDVLFTWMVSDDLLNWQPAGGALVLESRVNHGDGSETLSFSTVGPLPFGGAPSMMIRLQMELRSSGCCSEFEDSLNQ